MNEPVSAYAEASASLRAAAKELVAKEVSGQLTVDRAVITALMVAMFDAVRDEWNATVANAGLEHEVAVAGEMAKAQGYDDPNVICGLPGVKAYVATVDGKESVCFERSMFGLLPLVAIFTDKVRESIDVAAMVGERVAAVEAAKTPPTPSEGV